MIVGLLILTALFDTSFCLTEKGRIDMLRVHKGIDLEKRRERLQNLSLKLWGVNITAGRSTSSVNAKANLATATNATLGGVSSTDGSPPTIEELNRAEGIDEYLFGGDMVLTEDQLVAFEKQAEHPTRTKRQMTSPSRRWTNNRVYYYFDTNITAAHRAFVRKELNYLQTRTCLFFIENATAAARLKVIYGSGCWSYVGRLGGEQELSLGSGCMSVGIVAHEFIHALGSLHMHMRDDRDTYLNINMTAIPDSTLQNYVKATESINNTPYEYGSDMQYASNIYMTAKQARYQRTMGSRTVSFYDILMINRFYQCFAACAGKGVTGKCKNKGVPNPKNCNVCICPPGYGGALCAQRPAACGGTLAAAKTWKARNVTIGNATVTTMRDTYTVCSDWISAPAGKTIQIQVTALYGVTCNGGCTGSSIEPKTVADQGMTSPRICCPDQLKQILTTKVIPAPVVAYSAYRQSTFTYLYRYV